METNNIILNAFLTKLDNEKETVINNLKKLDLATISKDDIDEQFIYPFRNKYIFSVPTNIVKDAYLSRIFTSKCIKSYLEIEKCLHELYKTQ